MFRLTRPALGATLALASGLLCCAKARPSVVGAERCVSWKDEIGPLFAARCGACHGGSTPAASYSTATYAGALGGGQDAVSNAIAGDATSRVLTVLDPASADATHAALAGGITTAPPGTGFDNALFDTVRSWVVDCDVSYVRSSIHRGGILDPTSADFHGQLIRGQAYDFRSCQKCHGVDFAGGTAGVSCLSCHAEGPTACSTCHGAIAASGSHGRHLAAGPAGKVLACAECHRVPTTYTDVGHIFLADGTLDPPPAEVTFAPAATANLAPAGTTRLGAAAYDAGAHRCTNVYCHGAAFPDSAATSTAPIWNAPIVAPAPAPAEADGGAGGPAGTCGSCHGMPPDHAGVAACANCHPSVVDPQGKIIAPALHIDGRVELGAPSAGCAGCHGAGTTGAPPPALGGATAPTAPGVGAHQAHLTGAAHLRGPIACGECHLVPTEVASPGHIAGHGVVVGGLPAADATVAAKVFPASAGDGGLGATAGGAPRWDPATGTCAGVYCHGAGTVLGGDRTAGLARTPKWTDAGGLTCGVSCHGVPPDLTPHLATMTRTDCVMCHPRTIDPSGVVIVSGPPGAETSAHINGVVDVGR